MEAEAHSLVVAARREPAEPLFFRTGIVGLPESPVSWPDSFGIDTRPLRADDAGGGPGGGVMGARRRRGIRARAGAGAAALAVLVATAAGGEPGTPDPGFGDGGTVILAGTPAGAVSAAPAPDGGMVVVRGRDGGELVRLAADGSVVAGWGGATPVPCAERDEVDRDASGRYLLVCTSTAEDGSRVTDVLRYTGAGRLDRRFGAGGVVRLEGAVERAAAVPLPGGRVLALGGRPPTPGQPPLLVTTVLDRRGRVVTSSQEEVPLATWPPDQGNGVQVSVVAEPTRRGAVAAVHPGIVLSTPDWLRPSDPFLLVFGSDGAQVGRLEGPAYPAQVGNSTIMALAELPGGRIAALEERWTLRSGPRPTADYSWPVHVYAPDGTELHQFLPQRPATSEDPQVRGLAAATLLVTARGRHLLVGGTYSPEDYVTNGAVLRYDTATWTVDPTFGRAGLADVGWRVAVADLDPRDERAQVYATGRWIPTETEPEGVAVVRLWNRARPGG